LGKIARKVTGSAQKGDENPFPLPDQIEGSEGVSTRSMGDERPYDA
jgi:hypothetical protein